MVPPAEAREAAVQSSQWLGHMGARGVLGDSSIVPVM